MKFSKKNSCNINESVKEQINAIYLLASRGYTILDLEDNIINKWNINDQKRHNITYNRLPKNR